MAAEDTFKKLLALADIELNGSRPWDIQVNDRRLYKRVLRENSLGLGEAYMDGWWDVKRLDEFITRVLGADLRRKAGLSPALLRFAAVAYLKNNQTLKLAARNAGHHYNIGNDLYERMLDKRMIYSCGYWQDARNLDEAQIAKLDLVCRKLHLKKGMTLLDIGCGWGGFARFASENYGVKVTGISPAAEQVKLARQNVKGQDVTILQKDYREIAGKFDRIVSIGMLEHVGYKNYKTFFARCHAMLQDGGVMLHHMIGKNRTVRVTDPWIDRYIFPGGYLPSIADIGRSVEGRLIIEDLQNFGPYYDRTLMAWYRNFVKHYPQLCAHYDERFYRMWEYYLLTCAGAFRARNLQLWQFVMRRIEPADTYLGVR